IAPSALLDGVLVHAGEVIPGEVVGPHMVQAEPVVTVEIVARARRAVQPLGLAAGTVAAARGRSGRRAAARALLEGVLGEARHPPIMWDARAARQGGAPWPSVAPVG